MSVRSSDPRPAWQGVVLPSEHGGWGLTLEPVVLGLLIAPSAAGALIGLAAFVAFLARTPVKLVLVDRFRHRTLARTRLAVLVGGAEVALLALLLVGAALLATGSFWVPLAVAVPLISIELWFDMHSRSRRLVPEVAGTIGIGSVAAAIVLAAGGATSVAAGAWLLISARAVASLPFVRYQLRRGKRQPYRRWAEDLAQLGAVALVVFGVAVGWLSWAAAGAVGVLVVVQLALARVPPPRAVIVGVQQLLLGVGVMVVAGLTLR